MAKYIFTYRTQINPTRVATIAQIKIDKSIDNSIYGILNFEVRNAAVYPPRPMNIAWPKDKSPV